MGQNLQSVWCLVEESKPEQGDHGEAYVHGLWKYNAYNMYNTSIRTVKSLVGIIKALLKDPGLKSKYILSARFNQDPLENFFGHIRQSGGWSSNPSSKRVQEATDVIRLQPSSAMYVLYASFLGPMMQVDVARRSSSQKW